ncbi:uncharacterized protein C11orf53 homolog [Lemur catta]|uniref:uncharacterized protein C11orf53 homolog n=1 Tax=Lemur catta TaxID=9447 RepID=UPI001E268A24|nr:uncharacterized protein C11orf53 homolog [Lemur catta]
MESVPGDYSKRVYQGVRVKHTVKDLLAEKRSRQTSNSRFNGSVSSSQSAFVQLPGSPVTSGYYGVRRSFLSDSDFHGSKPFPNDVYSPSAAKPFPCEPAAGQGLAGLLEPCFPEPYGDYRAPALPPSAGSLFSAPALPPPPPLLPPFPGDPAHFVFRDSWEQTVPDSLSQPDPMPADTLQTLPPSTSCLSQLESGSTAQHRGSSWGASLAGAQSYSLHALEDLHHTPGYPTPPPYPFTPFMTVSNDLPPKAVPLSPDEEADTSSFHDPSSWTKEDGSLAWGSYDCRRAY